MSGRNRQQKMPVPNISQRQGPPQMQQPRQAPPQMQQPRQAPPQMQEPDKQSKPKMTIGDAIGLITIRLGRVEQFIQQLQTDGIDMNSVNSMQSFMDNGLMQNIVSRLNLIEQTSTTEEKIQNMETDLKDTKNLLMKLMLKFENFSDDTLAKFEEHQQQITFNLEHLQQDEEPNEALQENQSQNQNQDQEPVPTPSNESNSVP